MVDPLLRFVLRCFFPELDWSAAWTGMSGDLHDMLVGPTANSFSRGVIVATWALPVAAALVARRREPLAATAMIPWVLAFFLWFDYHAAQWERYGEPGPLPFSFTFLLFCSWCVLLGSALRLWRSSVWAAFHEIADPRPLFRDPT